MTRRRGNARRKFKIDKLVFDMNQVKELREKLWRRYAEDKRYLKPIREILPLHLVKIKHQGPLKILAFSDYRVHDRELLLNFVKSLGERPDIILYAGDDVDRFVPNPKRLFFDENPESRNYFEELARESRYGLGAVIGNDDLPSRRDHIKGEKVYELHHTWLHIGSYLVIGLECVSRESSIGLCLYAETDYRLRLELARSILGENEKLIIVSHAPPYGVLDRAMRFGERSIGSRALRDFLEEYDDVVLVICGHVHRYGGKQEIIKNTTVVNVSSHDDYTSRANIAWIVVDGDKVSVEFKKIPSPLEQAFKEIDKSRRIDYLIEQLHLSRDEAELFIKAYERYGDQLLEDLEQLASLKFNYGFTWDNVFKLYDHGVKYPEQITKQLIDKIARESKFPHYINIRTAYLRVVREREPGVYLLSPPPFSPSDKIIVFDTEYIPGKTPVLYGFLDLQTNEIKQFWYDEQDELANYLKSREDYLFIHWGGEDQKFIHRVNRKIHTVNIMWYVQTSLVAPASSNTLAEVHDALCGRRDDPWWNVYFYDMSGFIKLILCNRVLEIKDQDSMKQLSEANKADILALSCIVKKILELPVKPPTS